MGIRLKKSVTETVGRLSL